MKRPIILIALVLLAAALGLSRPPDLAATPRLDPAETVYVLNPTKDAYIVQTDPDQTYGRTANLLIGSQEEAEVVGYVAFDLPPELTTDAQIVSAEFRLYCVDTPTKGGGKPSLKVQIARTTWDENTISYRRKPTGGGNPTTWEVGVCADQWAPYVDVTDKVKDWVSGGSPNYGFYLGPVKNTDNNLWKFTSKDDKNAKPYPAGNQPQLRIVALPPPSATPTETETFTPTPSLTPTDTPTPSETPLPTDTPTITPTSEHTNTPTPTDTPIPTDTLTPLPGIYMPLVLKIYTFGTEPNHGLPTACPGEDVLPLCTPGPVPTACGGPDCPTPAPCPWCRLR